ncbi:hypothetical protein XCR1_70036 [Xenorhabdus cabanillasii JM26]|uniref:Uncharacterized protein n=1 Tax=Xenorhabdus cabanillasii JM26 TaxID=1427517 RepID=W1J7Y7_9GAMM|nr:hypothetical protein XCR1_70036 [Xenorhabdus cabanillasii JM26]
MASVKRQRFVWQREGTIFVLVIVLVKTEIHADGGEPDRVERIKDSLPMKRGGQPEEIAEAIA